MKNMSKEEMDEIFLGYATALFLHEHDDPDWYDFPSKTSGSLRYLSKVSGVEMETPPEGWVWEEDEYERKRFCMEISSPEQRIALRAKNIANMIKDFPPELAEKIKKVEAYTKCLRTDFYEVKANLTKCLRMFVSYGDRGQEIREYILRRIGDDVLSKPVQKKKLTAAEKEAIRIQKYQRYKQITEQELPKAQTNLEKIALYEEALPLVTSQKKGVVKQHTEKAQIFEKLERLYKAEGMFQKAETAKNNKLCFMNAAANTQQKAFEKGYYNNKTGR